MKTKIFLWLFLLPTIYCFGQVKTGNGSKGVSGTATGDWQPNRQVTPATSGNYGNTSQVQNSVGGTWEGNKWISNWLQNDCFSGIKYKVINYNLTNSNGAHWGIMVQNTYGQPASFKFKLTVGGTIWAGDGWDDAYMLGSGKVYTHSNSLVTAMTFSSSSSTFQVDIKDVKLNDNPIDCQGRILPKTTNKNANNQNAAVAEHDRIYGTNSTNQNENGENVNSQQNQAVINSTSQNSQNTQVVIEPDKSYEMTKQVFEISSNFVNAMQAQAVLEEKNNANIQNKELIKLAIEADFNDINSPEDYENVSLTSITYKNLIKLANIEVHKECGSAFANPETINGKAKKSSKIEAAFLGANTVYVKNFDVSRDNRYAYNRCVFEIFGFAQTNKVLNFEEIQKVLTAGKYEIQNAYKFKKNDDEFSKEKFSKDIEILGIKKNGNFIEVTANTKNAKTDKFRLINFNEEQFVFFYQDNDKLYNYIIKRN